MLKENTPIRFEWDTKWLKGEEYAHILQNMELYCEEYNLLKFSQKNHPDSIYNDPINGMIYFVRGNTIGSDFGFPRLGIKKKFKWKKMNFTTELPKKNPIVSYIVASAIKCEKFFPGSSLEGPVFRMHAVILLNKNEKDYQEQIQTPQKQAKGKKGKINKSHYKLLNATNYILCHIRRVQETKDNETNDQLEEEKNQKQIQDSYNYNSPQIKKEGRNKRHFISADKIFQDSDEQSDNQIKSNIKIQINPEYEEDKLEKSSKSKFASKFNKKRENKLTEKQQQQYSQFLQNLKHSLVNEKPQDIEIEDNIHRNIEIIEDNLDQTDIFPHNLLNMTHRQKRAESVDYISMPSNMSLHSQNLFQQLTPLYKQFNYVMKNDSKPFITFNSLKRKLSDNKYDTLNNSAFKKVGKNISSLNNSILSPINNYKMTPPLSALWNPLSLDSHQLFKNFQEGYFGLPENASYIQKIIGGSNFGSLNNTYNNINFQRSNSIIVDNHDIQNFQMQDNQ